MKLLRPGGAFSARTVTGIRITNVRPQPLTVQPSPRTRIVLTVLLAPAAAAIDSPSFLAVADSLAGRRAGSIFVTVSSGAGSVTLEAEPGGI